VGIITLKTEFLKLTKGGRREGMNEGMKA